MVWRSFCDQNVITTNDINDLNGEEIVGTFYEEELQKTNPEEFKIEKVIKRKGDKLYVKWKGYSNSFNSWIYEKNCIKWVSAFVNHMNLLEETSILKLIYVIVQQKQT